VKSGQDTEAGMQDLMITEARIDGDTLSLAWSDGTRHPFHALWLRERSDSPDNRDPGTGLRVTQAAFLPLDLKITAAEVDAAGALQLTFSDGHACGYAADELRHCISRIWPDDLVGEKALWDGSLANLPEMSCPRLLDDERAVLELLDTTARHGFSMVRDIPIDEGALEAFAERVGPVRTTNWGRITDVRSMENPYDLTMTPRSLSPHADNPYRLPGPGYIFLECLRMSDVGGESTIVDGFCAAQRLRAADPEAFEVLTQVAPGFRHAEDEAILEHAGPLIELGYDGDVRRIRYSNRTEQVPPLEPALLTKYYAARQAFADLIFAPEMTLTIKLKPGDGMVLDNFRILHGRTAFDPATGDRHLRHCYMDRDVVSSRQKVLLRRFG
jgi:gamma-butyrobetaine dioxygenase